MSPPYSIALHRYRPLDLMGLPVHPVTVKDVHDYIQYVITRGSKALVLCLNIHYSNFALKNAWLRDFLKEAQLVFCDGDGVRWGLRLLGENPPEKITYDRWIWQLAEFCEKRRYRIFFLGGKPGVAEAAGERLKEKFPALEIVGVHRGYLREENRESESVVQAINVLKPDILVVAFGMPVQEKWLMENWRRLDVHIFLTGGAVFDYVSGQLKRTPPWMIRCQLEWLYRFCQEPRRLFHRYAVGIPYFFLHIFLAKMAKGNLRSS